MTEFLFWEKTKQGRHILCIIYTVCIYSIYSVCMYTVYEWYEQSVFLLLSIATKRKFTQLLVTTKSASLLQVAYCKGNVSHWPQGKRKRAKAWKRWGGGRREIGVETPGCADTLLYLTWNQSKRGRGEVQKRDSGGGRVREPSRMIAAPVWAAKVQTWTSFISLQGHCPWREGSCHPALTSPQWASQLLKIPT